MLFSQGSGGDLAYDYTRQYTTTIIGYGKYILPEDSFVSGSDRFLINGGQCSKLYVKNSSHGLWYVYFALCKKGDIIASNGSEWGSYVSLTLTIIPARK